MSNNLTLWQLDEAYLSVLEEIDSNEGVLTEELEAKLDQAIHALIIKQDGYIKAMDILESYANQAKKWRDYMAEKIRSIQNQQERLKNALIQHLHAIGKTELQGELGKIKLMKTIKVALIDENVLPSKYKHIIQEVRIDKRALLEDLKAGHVEGAELQHVEYIKVF